MNNQSKIDLRTELQGCSSMSDMLQLVDRKFELRNKIHPLVKMIIIDGLISGLSLLNPKEKK